jgi:hypothetical protein
MFEQARQQKGKSMRIVFVLVLALAAVAANGQTESTTPVLESQLTQHISGEISRFSIEAKANEIVSGQLTYSGIAVELLNTRNPLQLINPAAPAEYGSPEDNVLRDPIGGRASGWKIFSIEF